jgi:hypothetical protein
MRSYLRLVSAAVALAAIACSSTTEPEPAANRGSALGHPGARLDDGIVTDTTCRSGWNSAQGKVC